MIFATITMPANLILRISSLRVTIMIQTIIPTWSPITPEIKDYSDDESRVNDARHIRDNYTTAFITGERNIRSNRGYYAIILTLIILLNISSNDKIIDIEQLYLNLFEQWDIPVGYRNDICITVNDINMGANNLQLKNKILFLIMSIDMSILFDSFRNISYTL